MVETYAQGPTARMREIDEPPTPLQGVGQGLLDQDVFAGFEGHRRHLLVERERRRDHDCVDVRGIEQIAPLGERPRVEFDPFTAIPANIIAEARRVVHSAALDIGGVEYFETAEGDRIYFDINATSVYRNDITKAFGVDPQQELIRLVQARLGSDRTPRRAVLTSFRG